MVQYSPRIDLFRDKAVDQVSAHFKNNPFRFHFAAWLMVAVPIAVLMMPEYSMGSAIGFGISAIVFCTILSFVTYPLSGHFSFTIVGVLVGAITAPIGELVGVFSPMHGEFTVVCALMGAIIGSTSVIWRVPLQILDAVRQLQTR